MKARELREMSDDVLDGKEQNLGENLFKLRFQNASRQLENTARMREVRRDIARIKTIKTERERKQTT